MNNPTQATLIHAIAATAEAWRDPDYQPRAEAVDKTLAAVNRFTEEAIAFAINQRMSVLTQEGLSSWAAGHRTDTPLVVGVLESGTVPFSGLRDLLAVLLTGHRAVGCVSEKSPYLLPAFVDDLLIQVGELEVHIDSLEVMLHHVNAVIATVDEEIQDKLAASQVADQSIFLHGTGYGVAVLDGHETEDEREALAEDLLLHEGLSRYSVRLVFAPNEVDVDPYFEAFAAFRSVFPVHPDTAGALKMQQAFLTATKLPHAYGDGLEFLVSRGDPDPQLPGHIRWATYEALDEVAAWFRSHEAEVTLVVNRGELGLNIPASTPVIPLGDAHRPTLERQARGRDVMAFLDALNVNTP